MAKAAAATATPKKAPSKSEILASIAEATQTNKKVVATVLEAIGAEIKNALGKKCPGVFAIHGLVKIEKMMVPTASRPTRCPQSFQAWRTDGRGRQAGLDQDQVRPLKGLQDGLRLHDLWRRGPDADEFDRAGPLEANLN